jgi:hypothetical protein
MSLVLYNNTLGPLVLSGKLWNISETTIII